MAITVALTTMAEAGPWPGWRGPRFGGAVEGGSYPTALAIDQTLVWKAELPGAGSSTPSVWGDRIFLTAGVNGQDTVLCYDLAGKAVWQRSLSEERRARNRSATGSNPSTVTDGRRVFAYFKSGTLAALDPATGEVQWKVDLQAEYGPDRLLWDLGTSPVLTREAVVVAVMQEREAFLVALDQETGRERWVREREVDAPAESNDAYTTPQVVTRDGEEQILTWGGDTVTLHRADNGREVWRCEGFNPDQRRNWRTIASAVAADGMVLVPYGRGDLLAGVRLEGRGNVTRSAVVWNRDASGPDVPTPAIRNGRAYVLNDRGTLTCLDLTTGRDQWTFDLPRAGGNFYASPLVAGDLVYAVRQEGEVYVGRAGSSGFELLSQTRIEDGFVASPVPVDGGRILLRGTRALYCFGAR